MAPVTPFWDPADHLTVYCKGAVVGGTFVAIAGPATSGLPTVGTAGGGTSGLTGSVVGVAQADAAVGATVDVMTDGVAEVVAGSAISAGDKVFVDATGSAVPVGGGFVFHGIALDDIASAATGPIRLQLNRAIH